MKKLCVLAVVALVLSGCARFQHAESIDVDRFGATGHYQDSRSGKLYSATLGGGGGGGGVGVAALGGFICNINSSQSQSDPTNFAKAIAMVDMSKKLKSVRYDEDTGIREYEFVQPLAQAEGKHSSNPPPSFGRRPVQ